MGEGRRVGVTKRGSRREIFVVMESFCISIAEAVIHVT